MTDAAEHTSTQLPWGELGRNTVGTFQMVKSPTLPESVIRDVLGNRALAFENTVFQTAAEHGEATTRR